MAGILIDYAIRRAIAQKTIVIEPFNDAQINPASYDLTLGDEVSVYTDVVRTPSFNDGPQDGSLFTPYDGALDVKSKPEVQTFKIDPKVGWQFVPGIGYLFATKEKVGTKNFVPVLDGKSSLGRLFIMCHYCAGYGDAGFFGNYTLEVSALHRIRIYPGMRICQIRFHTLDNGDSERTQPDKLYDQTGHYVGKDAEGPVASQAYKQFG